MTGNTASTPLPLGPIWELRVTTTPTNAATKPARNTKSYQGRLVRGMRTKPNGWTMKVQAVNTTTLRADADHAVHWTGLSTKTAASHIANAADMLSHIECRWAIRT